MSGMFFWCKAFEGDPKMSEWDVKNVKSMHEMFMESSFDVPSLIEWDVSKVEDMSWMFAGTSFTGNISTWEVGDVRNFSGTF